MPERNLVTKPFVNSLSVLVIVLTLISAQVGCSKLRQSSFDNDFVRVDESRPSWNNEPTPLTPPAKNNNRFVNDPQKALEELNDAAGDLNENLSTEFDEELDRAIDGQDLEARIIGVSDLIDTDQKQIKLTATPPAPIIANGSTPFPPAQAIDRSSFPQTELRPTKDLKNTKLAHGDDESCDDFECDCMKPKLEPVLPFAEPIAFVEPAKPSVSTMAPPSQLVSQPLSPILFDEDTRQVGNRSTAEMKNNLLRTPAETLEKPVSGIVRQEFNTPPTTEWVAPAPVVLNSNIKEVARMEMATTQFSGFVDKSEFENKSPCTLCETGDCGGECAPVRRTTLSQLRPMVASEPIKRENVIIVATTSNDTVPPFADPPAMDVVESVPEIFVPEISAQTFAADMPEAAKPFVAEAGGAFSPVSEPLVEKVAFNDFNDLTEQDWTDMFGPVSAPEQPSQSKACPGCNSSQCNGQDCSHKMAQPEFNPSADLDLQFNQEAFGSVASKNEVQTESTNEFVAPQQEFQAAPIEVAANDDPELNQFQSNGFIVSEETLDTDEGSNWVAPTANFSPVTPVATPTVETPFVEPLVEKEEYPTPDSNYGHEEGLFPKIDTSIPPEPQVIIEVIDNTVPWSVKLAETIENVKLQLSNERDSRSRNGLEVNLRLLEVLQRQMTTVEENQNVLSNVEREYWQHQLDAITLMLPSNDTSTSDLDRHKTAYDTLDHLRKAVERLESIANLKVSNGTFCTEISGFGKFSPFPSTTFKAGQKTLVYCEVENYLSQVRTANYESSYHTTLRGSYVIYDQQGRAVQQMEYPTVEDASRKRRRDFYMYFPIEIGKLAPGNYKLELLVEDLGGNKTASLSPGMAFQVR